MLVGLHVIVMAKMSNSANFWPIANNNESILWSYIYL